MLFRSCTVYRPKKILVVDFFVQWAFISHMDEAVVMGKLVSTSLERIKDDLPPSPRRGIEPQSLANRLEH